MFDSPWRDNRKLQSDRTRGILDVVRESERVIEDRVEEFHRPHVRVACGGGPGNSGLATTREVAWHGESDGIDERGEEDEGAVLRGITVRL